MRTDVKIGIAVGLLIVIAVVSYYAFFGGGGAEPNEPTELAAGGPEDKAPAPGERSDANGIQLPRFEGIAPGPAAPGPAGGSPNVPAAGDTRVTPRIGDTGGDPRITPRIDDTGGDTRITPRIDDTGGDTRITPRIDDTGGDTRVSPRIGDTRVSPRIEDLGSGPRITPRIGDAGGPRITPRIGDTGGSDVLPGARLIQFGGARVYIVQKGDAGFWGIAEKVYGEGRLWTLISKANPNARSNALAIGEKLRIPPKPAPRTIAPAPGGGLAVVPGGGRIYVVRKGDAGFWGIAQEVYGNGKYWPVLAKANPNVTSTALQPGTRLVVPPAPAPGSTSRPAASPFLPGPGQKVYTVKKGDAGFWGIAQEVYGEGKYWPVIADANPSVSSSSLQAGQKLLVPELTEALRRSYRPTTTRIGPSRRLPADGRPVFD